MRRTATMTSSSRSQRRADFFCRCAEHFHDCRWAPPQVRCFPKFWRGRPLAFGRSVTPVELIFSSSRSTLVVAEFLPENFLNKCCELQFFSWCKALISAIVFTDLTSTEQTPLKLVTYYGYCHSLDGATLFPKVDSNKWRVRIKNEITLICTKFVTDLINILKVTNCWTKVFFALPCIGWFSRFDVCSEELSLPKTFAPGNFRRFAAGSESNMELSLPIINYHYLGFKPAAFRRQNLIVCSLQH